MNALYEGDLYDDWDTVLTDRRTVRGVRASRDARAWARSARRTGICTNAAAHRWTRRAQSRCCSSARRDDAFAHQPGDGFSAMVGGAKRCRPQAQASLFGGKTVGTIPHALIAALRRRHRPAATRFAEAYPEDDSTSSRSWTTRTIR